MSQTLFDQSMQVLSKSMDMYLLKHSVHADNIANSETPYFKARRVEFEDQLNKAVEIQDFGYQVNENSLNAVKPVIYEEAESEVGQDLNTVDMDREMALLSKNEVRYSAATQAVTKKFGLLRYAIMGDGGGN